MKKILCVMVAVVLCFGAVLVTASAETPMYNYNGVDLPYPPISLYGTDYSYFYIVEESNDSFTLIASTAIAACNYADGYLHFRADGNLIYYNTSNPSNGWVKFGETSFSANAETDIPLESIIWNSYDINSYVSSIPTTLKRGDSNFSLLLPTPLYEEINGVTGEAVNGLANDTFDTLGVLVPIGIAIMAIFLGVALIPRVIYKFL